MKRAVLGASLMMLALTACDTMPDGKGGGINPNHAAVAHAVVPITDEYATSPDGTKIHYLASGKGPLVLMIHGFPDFSETWSQLTPA